MPPSPPMSPLNSPPLKSASFRTRHVTPMDAAITAHFPPLETEVVTAEFPGLNALEFFHVFLSDAAPYSFKEFQQTQGDVNIEYGQWRKNDLKSFSFHPNTDASMMEKMPLPTCSKKDRVLAFKTLTKSYFGPAYASATKTQRVAKFSTRLVIIESRTELFDIPYCDRFFVLERWILEAVKHDGTASTNSSMLYTTKISVSVEVFMLKACPWEKQIRQKTLSTVSDLVTSWAEKAKQALDLTLQNKLERMRMQHNDMQDNKSLYSYRSKETKRSRGSRSRASHHTSGNKSLGHALALPGESEQALMDLHQRQFKLLEEKIVSGDLEWCSIEMKLSREAGEGKAFTEVLNPTSGSGVTAAQLEDGMNRMDIREISITTQKKSKYPIIGKKRSKRQSILLLLRKNKSERKRQLVKLPN